MSRVAHPAGPRHAGVPRAGHPPAPPSDLNALDPAVWPRGARRAGGALTLAGLDVRDLAGEYGTPLFVLDEADFRGRCRDFRRAFGADAAVSYAAAAFCSRGVLRWAAEEGLGVGVCTGGELGVALAAGVDPAMITLHGSNKLTGELERALGAGAGRIVADSYEEIARLAHLTEEIGAPGSSRPADTGGRRRPQLLVRVASGVEAHAHEFMAAAHDDQKFGFSLFSGAADEAVRRVLAAPGLDLAGLHCHIGSQIHDAAGFEVAARRVLELAGRTAAEHGLQMAELNLGGGFGIASGPGDAPADIKIIAQDLHGIVRAQCAAAGLAVPRLAAEPGRAIAGPGTVTLYEVGTVKDVDGLRTYVSVDGAMSDNIRTAPQRAEHACVLASRESAAPAMLSRLVGRHSENGDIVVRDAYLPADLVPGDLVAVAATGAYCRSMAGNHNHLPRPPVVAVGGGTARVMLRRETAADLLALDEG
ncbi:MAG TPA: diaminopimelate decarboxylase [Streptosporangiaceae bacterium]|nr:diaminopimelate decarboxylase [Streptosporangiaceae bacterium]